MTVRPMEQRMRLVTEMHQTLDVHDATMVVRRVANTIRDDTAAVELGEAATALEEYFGLGTG